MSDTVTKPPTYSTLATPGTSTHDYHDRDSLPFNARYPLIDFKDTDIAVGADSLVLQRELVHNYWYQKSNTNERQMMLERVVHINKNLQPVLDFIEAKYSALGFKLLHISIAGSYAHAVQPGDIDLDVIVEGSFFDYSTFNDGIDLLDTVGSVRKISVTVMGMDNILGTAFTHDDIRNDGFVHHDTIIREMIVAPMRNITVYGKVFDHNKNIDSRNVLVRIARQLYFAELTLDGKIPYYSEDPLRTKKATNRIREAYQIIDWLLQSSQELRN
jgi:hypothetical protein